MESSPVPLAFPVPLALTADHARALRAHLARMRANLPAADSLHAVIDTTLGALDTALARDHAASVVAERLAQWEQSRQALAQASTRLVRTLKKTGPTLEGFEALRSLGQASARCWRTMGDGRQVDADTFAAEAFLKNPAAWTAAVEESLRHQAVEREALQALGDQLRAHPGAPLAEPADATVARAAKDCWGKALDSLGFLGTQPGELDVPALQEAVDYGAYGQAFLTGDHASVAKRHRVARHGASLFLRTFTPAMTAAAEAFCEHESLAWQQALVEQRTAPARPKP